MGDRSRERRGIEWRERSVVKVGVKKERRGSVCGEIEKG